MKKTVLIIVALFGLTLIFMPVNRAAAVDFSVSAEIPTATGVSIVATPVNATTNVFGTPGATSLDFGILNFNTALGIWLPVNYYAIDVGVTGGAGSTNVNVSYTIGAKPTGQVDGLEMRATATFVTITGGPLPTDQTEQLLTSHGPTKLLNQIIGGGEAIASTELNGGFFRVYVGIYPGGISAIDTAGGAPFTNADLPGDYDGTLTITATVV